MPTARRLVLSSLLLLGWASAGNAATILLDQCNVAGICNQVGVTTTLVGNAIDVDVFDVVGAPTVGLFGSSGANRAFGFNVVGSDAGLSISNVTDGFSFAPTAHMLGGGFGQYEFVIGGPGSASSATLPLHFQVTRTGGFSSDLQLFEANDLGYFFNAHVWDASNGVSGWASTKTLQTTTGNVSVPEPAMLTMLGLGLTIAARRLRGTRRS